MTVHLVLLEKPALLALVAVTKFQYHVLKVTFAHLAQVFLINFLVPREALLTGRIYKLNQSVRLAREAIIVKGVRMHRLVYVHKDITARQERKQTLNLNVQQELMDTQPDLFVLKIVSFARKDTTVPAHPSIPGPIRLALPEDILQVKV